MTIRFTSEKQGLSGKDSVRIANGTYSISSGTDAIHAENSDDEDLGFLYIEGGDFTIVSEGDGMSASSYVQIKDGSFDIVTGEGSAGVEKRQGDFWQHVPLPWKFTASQESDEVSMKGTKQQHPSLLHRAVLLLMLKTMQFMQMEISLFPMVSLN